MEKSTSNPESNTVRNCHNSVERKTAAASIMNAVQSLAPAGERFHEGGKRLAGKTGSGKAGEPLISIICAVYNGQAHIESAIRSVLDQDYDNVEIIVIDGGSEDGTVSVLQQLDGEIDYWISEPDGGIADAWNKGLKCCTGDIIGILNADDMYASGTFRKVVDKLGSLLDVPVVTYGNTQMIGRAGCGKYIPAKFNKDALQRGFGFMHPSCFSTREAYKLLGGFSTDLRIAVDTEWLVRAVLNDVEFRESGNLTYMREGGVSDEQEWQGFREYLTILEKHGFDKLRKAKYLYLLKYTIRKLVGKNRVRQVRLQLIYLVIFICNLLYNWIPFFRLKKLFAGLIGINIGSDSYIHTPVRFFSVGRISIGDNTTINTGCYLDNRAAVKIGNNVTIAHDTKIYTAGHDINDPCFRGVETPVLISDDVCIFANVLIMPGVKVGKGAVIYPGSVVTRDVEAYSIVGGNPAVHIGRRNDDIRYRLDYKYWFSQ